MKTRGHCTVLGCNAPLPYKGRGRPRVYCEAHGALAAQRAVNARNRRWRARQRAKATA